MAIIYVDKNNYSGTLTGTLSFVNGATVVNGINTSFNTELVAGNYISPLEMTEWYRVNSVTDHDTLALTWAFRQSNANATNVRVNSLSGNSTTTAYSHLRQATQDSVRSPGDIIKLRANQTHTHSVSIHFDEDGTIDNYITLKGCDDADDPFGDGSSVKPTFGFNNGNYYFYFNGDNYWKLQNLIVMDSTYTNGAIYYYNSKGFIGNDIEVKNCVCGINIRPSTNGYVELENCSISGCSAKGLYLYNYLMAKPKLRNLYIGGCGYGIYTGFSTWKSFDLENVLLENNSTADIYLQKGSFKARNLKMDSTTQIVKTNHPNQFIKIEDYNASKLSHRSYYYSGDIFKNDTIVKNGSDSLEMESSSDCNDIYPLKFPGNEIDDSWSNWLENGSHSVSIYIKGENWSTLPNATELYTEIEYYDATSANRTITRSNNSLSFNGSWIQFNMSFNVYSDSPCYLNGRLSKYSNAANKIYVDNHINWS